MTVGSILLKSENISIPEAYVDKKLEKFFLQGVSNWKLKWRKINLNLKFSIFVIADQKMFDSVFSMSTLPKRKINQINSIKLKI